MDALIKQSFPSALSDIDDDTKHSGFTMASEPLTGSLLRTLAASKKSGAFLEMGTGTGLSTSWILSGMDATSSLISVDNDPDVQGIARKHLDHDARLSLVLADGGEWLAGNKHRKFDFIFADSWHGKYLMLESTLSMLNPGGLYIIDDMLPQPNWPEGHPEKVVQLVSDLESRTDFFFAKLHWATGIMLGVKTSLPTRLPSP